MGELIKKERGCKVFGAEINKNAARIAKGKLDEVFCVDIEKSDLPFNKDLDVIIFADIIEHLFDPWRVLESAKKWLKPDGIVIASIPNIGHYSIILDLLRGRWDYLPFGHLCISHIRFFTRVSMENMFTKSGYSIRNVKPWDFPLHAKEQILMMLKKFIRTESIGEDIFYPGYYIVAKKAKPL
jgi:SAM-dependent methyltransferase